MLVLRKPLSNGKQHNWATNTFYGKYEPHEVSFCNIRVLPKCLFYFFQASEEGKSDNDNDYKTSWTIYCSRTILDSVKQTKCRHYSHVTKSQILRQFSEQPLQAPKIIFKSPKLIGQKSLSYGHLLKDKRLKFGCWSLHFWEGLVAIQVLVRKSLLLKET